MPAITADARQSRIQANEDAADARIQPAPYCTAIKRDGSPCLRPTTGDTDYCRHHQENPHTNYDINSPCAHERWDGRQCQVMVWAVDNPLCMRHRDCDCDACQTGANG